MDVSGELVRAAKQLADELRPLRFSLPVTHTYLTLDHAGEGYAGYLEKFVTGRKRALFIGMNPGPYGMVQTGVPFGEVAAVRDWMGLNPRIGVPENEHPKRRVQGMACPKSEVSGKRLWGLFAEKFPHAPDFFESHVVVNFCPLVWMRESGANLTPDKIKTAEMLPVDAACQKHLRHVLQVLEPEFLIGVGGYAEKQLLLAKDALGLPAKVGKILHPSPASPAANRGWAEAAERQLKELGVW
jgi:single-strand selective monofunctional uracil DNA glycosylase